MEPLVVDAGEVEIEELLDTLEAGRRVVVRTELLGSSHEVTLRHDGVWYCDTPTRLHKHDSREEMRACLKRQGYGRE
jgi:hemin uptake protein HemP